MTFSQAELSLLDAFWPGWTLFCMTFDLAEISTRWFTCKVLTNDLPCWYDRPMTFLKLKKQYFSCWYLAICCCNLLCKFAYIGTPPQQIWLHCNMKSLNYIAEAPTLAWESDSTTRLSMEMGHSKPTCSSTNILLYRIRILKPLIHKMFAQVHLCTLNCPTVYHWHKRIIQYSDWVWENQYYRLG